MVIAIDPDVKKSGVYIRFDDGKEDYKALTIVELRDYFCNTIFKDAKVVIECSYLKKKSNFRRKHSKSIGYNEKLTRDAGKNEGACLQIIAFAKEFYHEKDLYLIEPIQKYPYKIRGKWSKQSRAVFKAKYKPKKKLNDDMRDARLIYEKMKNRI